MFVCDSYKKYKMLFFLLFYYQNFIWKKWNIFYYDCLEK